MPAFAKSPKFIIGTLVVLWVAYVIWANFAEAHEVDFFLVPYFLKLQVRLSAALIGAAVFGAAATLIIQFFWRRSKNGASTASFSKRTLA
ncbi:MAG TPA: hypothetical protein VEJ86_12670 [Candidatus Binataceae bacterium]|nr:hypothetical protein [Candidatus Binataceae bacterium]